MRRIATTQQSRDMANSGRNPPGEDDLGGPGGQEPVDPTARAKQNASVAMKPTTRSHTGTAPKTEADHIHDYRKLQNRTMACMVLLGVPFFYMVGRPRRIAEAEIDSDKAAAASHGLQPSDEVQEVKNVTGRL